MQGLVLSMILDIYFWVCPENKGGLLYVNLGKSLNLLEPQIIHMKKQ